MYPSAPATPVLAPTPIVVRISAFGFRGLKRLVEEVAGIRVEMLATNKVLLVLLLALSLFIALQGKNYRLVSMTGLVALGMVAMDRGISTRLLGTSPGDTGLVAGTLRMLAMLFVSEILFGALCAFAAFLIEIYFFPLFCVFTTLLGISVLSSAFGTELRALSLVDIAARMGMVCLCAYAAKRFDRTAPLVHALLFGICGLLFVWMCLEAIVEVGLGLDALCSALIDGKDLTKALQLGQLYLFAGAVAGAVFCQMRFEGILHIYGRRPMSVLSRGSSKIIKV